MKVTVLGASGFIGSHLVDYLREKQIDYWAPNRDEPNIYKYHLGCVIYCIGLTADFRTRPFDTIEAHVSFLARVLKRCKFNSFLYLSSVRLYGAGNGIAQEEDTIKVKPLDPDYLYNISKAMGESICFAMKNDRIKVVRLSNVYGNDTQSKNFIPSLIEEALVKKEVLLHTSLYSEKDYINVKDVVKILLKIVARGQYKIYNVASGENTTNNLIANELRRITGCTIKVDKDSKRVCYPSICINRLKYEFAFGLSNIIDDLKDFVK